MQTVQKRVIVEGQVQGVGYRAWTLRKAQELGLSGWVKNLTDGRVEILLCGASQQVQLMIEHCKQGPRVAEVRSVLVEDAEGAQLEQFRILRTE